jgi:dTMP kinase
LFVSLEGVDGSGKSTQAKLLAAALGPDTRLVRESEGTDAARRIGELLADPAVDLDAFAELLLASAANADLASRVIRPALEAGKTLVVDRFADSSVAYYGGALQLGASHVLSLADTAIDGLWPDLTVLLRLDPEIGIARARDTSRIGSADVELQHAVAEAYEEIAKIASDRVVAVDALGDVEDVHRRVMEVVHSHPVMS